MNASALEIYEILKGIGLAEDKARKFVDYIEEGARAKIEKELQIFATKEDLANLKVDLVKWMFIFWVGQVAIISGIIFAMLKLYFK